MPSLTLKNFTFCTHKVFVAFLYDPQNMQQLFPIIFITEPEGIYCVVKTEYPKIIHINFRLSRRPLTVAVRVRFRGSPRKICGGQSDSGSGVSPSTSLFRCLYNSINASDSALSEYCHYLQDKWAQHW